MKTEVELALIEQEAQLREHYEELQRQALGRLRNEILQYVGHELRELKNFDIPKDASIAQTRVDRLIRFFERLKKREF